MSTSRHTSHGTSRRSLHLVDLENLVGGPRVTGDVAHDTFHRYLERAGWQPGDHVIVASNPRVIREVGFDLAVPCNVHATRGPDGADLMLLSLAPPELVTRRYERFVIGSGDGIFAARAHAVREAGVEVLIVSRLSGCSRRFAGLTRTYLDVPILDRSQALQAA
jgi:hypothetical protein